jgi:hypothetical protein
MKKGGISRWKPALKEFREFYDSFGFGPRSFARFRANKKPNGG